MLIVSLLEMWFYKRIFINAKGEPYAQWSIYFESKLKKLDCDDLRCVRNKIFNFSKKFSLLIWQKWLEIGLPFIKQIIKK